MVAGGDPMPRWLRPSGDELAGGGGERAGQRRVVAAEPDEHLASVAGDLAGGEDGDAGQWLPVEQQQGAGDPVGGIEGGVVQQPGRQCPPLVLADRRAGGSWRGGDVQVLAVPAVSGPGQEVPRQAG